ncbi:MAG TPA: phosphoribosyltransferase [Candidatus Acidoferrales bacterium]|nr:phosphoribosyltransferase [Candidatus Acidoferrales bacterium]
MFKDRIEAGKKLAEKLVKHAKNSTIVVALPRGGVTVGYQVAQLLQTPLEVVIVRKLGSPRNPELGIGAVAEDGVLFWDTDMIDMLQIPNNILRSIKEQEVTELERRRQLYRNGDSLPLLTNKTVILVDDGLATGVTARAALLSIKKHHPKKIILAVPVCSKETGNELRSWVDSIICLESLERLEAIGQYYQDFRQVTDEEVMTLLKKAKEDKLISSPNENGFEHKIVW